MNDEIKEILELFAFTDENIMFGDIVELNSKQSHLLLDYITNLQEENEYSNHCNEELRKKITNLEYKIERLEEELKLSHQDNLELLDYKSRNEKAIEYIEERFDYVLKNESFLDHDDLVERRIALYLLNILKGDNK